MSRSMPPTSPPAGPPDLAPARPGRADHLRLVSSAGPAGAALAGSADRPAVAKPIAKPAAKHAAARSLGDWLWHGLGAGVATASAGFATYALVFSTGEVVPSGNFNLFSRAPLARQAAAARHAEPGGDAKPSRGEPGRGEPDRSETADAGGVDFAPTGSLAGAGAGAANGGAGVSAGARRGPDGPALPDFTLRDVFDGKALVESRSSLSVVKPGSMLDGAGEVLSIEKRGERWIVLTRNGVIAGQRR